MKQRSTLLKRVLPFMLAMVMILASVPLTTFAETTEISESALKTLAQVDTAGVAGTIATGALMFQNKNHAFASTTPDYLLGKGYFVSAMDGYEVTVKTDGWIYILTPAAANSLTGQDNSLVGKLEGFETIAEFGVGVIGTTIQEKIALLGKAVSAGDIFSVGRWGILVADAYVQPQGVVLQEFAAVSPSNGEGGVVTVGELIFTDRTNHKWGANIPSWLAGQNCIIGSLDNGLSATVTKAGWIYVLSPNVETSTGTFNQADALKEQGFAEITVLDAGVMASTIGESVALLGKYVEKDFEFSCGKWGVLLADLDEDYTPVNPADLALVAPKVIFNPGSQLAEHPEYAKYLDGNRQWQGIPSMAKDNASGRLWYTFYSGGTGEGPENFTLVYTSNNDGLSWTGPVIAVDPEDPVRSYDCNLWTDPTGRLWLFWAQSYDWHDGRCGVWAMYTEQPGKADAVWSDPVRIANGVAMCDPVVLHQAVGELPKGAWLLPTAVWASSSVAEMAGEKHPNAYVSLDQGATWSYYSSVPATQYTRQFDENIIVQNSDGFLSMYIRTVGGMERSNSVDGKVWTNATYAGMTQVASRFWVGTLEEGVQLAVYNDPPTGGNVRSHMTVALSYDDGKTWPHKLVIDVRSGTSYPDVHIDNSGNIYVAYDCGRTANGQMLMAKITKADIVAGEASGSARLQVLVNDNTERDNAVVYIPINDGSGNVSYHPARLNIDQMVLRADNKDANGKASPGLYFNHRFDGDAVVKEQVASYGIAFSLAEGIDFETALKGEGTLLYKNSVVYRADDVVYTKLDGQSFGQKDATATSTLITGVMKEENGASAQMPIYGVAYIKLTDGTVILGAIRERSFQQQLEGIDTQWDSLSDGQRKGVLKMYKIPTIKTVVDDWTVPNLKDPTKAQKVGGEEENILRVLSIGNSHTDNATEYLYSIFQAENPDQEVQVAQLYYSGCTVSQHISFAAKNEAVYRYRTHDNRNPAGYATMRQALNAEIWDVIILHEMNNSGASEKTYTGVSRRNLEKHINYIKANCLNSDPKFIWNFSWANPTSEYLWSLGYPADLKYNTYNWVENYKEDFGPELSVMYGNMLEAMKANTRKYIATNDSIADIAPTGLAFQYARDNNPNQADPDELLYSDYTHAGPGFGRLLVGYVWYATLMGKAELTELNYTQDLSETEQTLLLNAVNYALANKTELLP